MDHAELVEKLTEAVLRRLDVRSNDAKRTATTIDSAVEPQGGSSFSGNVQKGLFPSGVDGPREDRQRESESRQISSLSLNRFIDHTLLQADASGEMVEKLCEDALHYQFYSVCVNSCWVELCAKKLGGSGVKVVSVIDFPLGAMERRSKAFETRAAVGNGADEIDVVMNIGALKSGNMKTVIEDMRAVFRSVRQKTIVKVVVETSLLTDDEILLACRTVEDIGLHFFQTSTGFFQQTAQPEVVTKIRGLIDPSIKVKAAGKISSLAEAEALVEAGASRIGTCTAAVLINYSRRC